MQRLAATVEGATTTTTIFSKDESLTAEGGFMNGVRRSKLREMDVIDAVCVYLERSGWTVQDRVQKVTQRGPDITAESPSGHRVLIEAKGGRSSKHGSARRRKRFDSSQFRDHLANALFKSCEAISSGNGAAIAVPDVIRDQDLVQRIGPVLRKLRISVLMVDEAKGVRVEGAPLRG